MKKAGENKVAAKTGVNEYYIESIRLMPSPSVVPGE